MVARNVDIRVSGERFHSNEDVTSLSLFDSEVIQHISPCLDFPFRNLRVPQPEPLWFFLYLRRNELVLCVAHGTKQYAGGTVPEEGTRF